MSNSKVALNPPQFEAASHGEGPILVLAGAGSGKTRVLTHRVAYLVEKCKVSPQQILSVTFTNKATDEMRERLRKMLGEAADKLWVATFHSAALRMLRRHANLLGYLRDFVVYDEDDAKSLMKGILKEQGIDEKRYPPQLFLRVIDQAKNSYLQPHQYEVEKNNPFSALARDVYEQYQSRLLQSNAMDFGDLLVNALRLLDEHPDVRELYQRQVRFLLVDEFQDTNLVQYLLIRRFVEKHQNLFVVGDDDQSIYRFRGATIRNILDFEKDFPKARVVVLDQNYRSSSVILEAANAIISKNPGRKPKRLWTAQAGGDGIQTYVGEDENDEARFIAEEILQLADQGLPLSDIAVFYRTNAQSRALEEAFLMRRVPYKIFGGMRFYERKEIRDMIAYLRLIVNEHDSQSFLRTINNPPRGIGVATVRVVQEFAQSQNVSFIQAARTQSAKHKGLAKFIELYDSLKKDAKHLPLYELLREVVERSEYGPRLRATRDPQSLARQENIDELIGLAATSADPSQDAWGNLSQFLDRVSLTSSTDIPSSASNENQSERAESASSVCMMTLHLAKGLEFPVVFLTGMEEGLLPHYRSIEEPQGIEEERRLCYVGITRAMKRLYLTRSLTRGLFSSGDSYAGFLRPVSRFSYDLPTDHMTHRSFDFLSGGYDLDQLAMEPESQEEDQKDLSELVCSADALESKQKVR